MGAVLGICSAAQVFIIVIVLALLLFLCVFMINYPYTIKLFPAFTETLFPFIYSVDKFLFLFLYSWPAVVEVLLVVSAVKHAHHARIHHPAGLCMLSCYC